jgi:environmental stress-induced protein Ves
MTVQAVRLDAVPSTLWKNGLGRPRVRPAWPAPDLWLLRVCVAAIEADAPFSRFDGVDRCIAVLQGRGIVLTLPSGPATLTPEGHACTFAGEDAPDCKLMAGPTRDLNLMVRRNAGRAVMQRAPLSGSNWAWRGVYEAGVLHWTVDAHDVLPPGMWQLGMVQT